MKRAVTIIIHRQMDNMPEIDDVLDEHVTKPLEVFMQELEKRFERRMREKENG